MACARSESIFCWPRTRDFFLRNDFLDDARRTTPEALDALDNVLVLWRLCMLEAFDFFAALPAEERWLACTGIRAQAIISIQIALTLAA